MTDAPVFIYFPHALHRSLAMLVSALVAVIMLSLAYWLATDPDAPPWQRPAPAFFMSHRSPESDSSR
jgi:hypothetical protein